MKKLGILGIGLLALSTACSGGGFGGDSPSYSGKIVDWPAAKTGVVRVEVNGNNNVILGASTAVDASGGFSSLLFPESAVVAPTLNTSSVGPCAGVNFNPTTVKTALAQIKVLNNTSGSAGSVFEGNRSLSASNTAPAAGDKQILRFYADSNAVLKGTCANASSTIIYDISVSTGWNIVILELIKVSGTTVVEGKATSGSLPSDSKLFYLAGVNPLSIGNLFK